MIYTIGYQRLNPSTLAALLDALQVQLLIDVRSSPNSRKPGFSRKALETQLGLRYEWRGDRLGGRGDGPTKAGLDELAGETRTVMLMCLEHLPGDCHRYHAIALSLAARGVDCWHVVADEVLETAEVTRALASDECRYSCLSLADVVASLASSGSWSLASGGTPSRRKAADSSTAD